MRTIRSQHEGRLSYLLFDEGGFEAALIDPYPCDLVLIRAMLDEGGLRLRWVLRTHVHEEAAEELAALRALGAPVLQGTGATDTPNVTDGDVLMLGTQALRVLATPGHTAHCVSYQWQDRLFCGDLLDATGCIWQPQPTDPSRLWDSVTQRIFTLPDEVLLFPAHAMQGRSVSTVHDERLWHHMLARCTRDEFLQRIRACDRAAGTRT